MSNRQELKHPPYKGKVQVQIFLLVPFLFGRFFFFFYEFARSRMLEVGGSTINQVNLECS